MPGKILVAEDSNTQAVALQAVLESAGFAVERVASGEQALERLSGEQFDLVLSDIMMPGMTGYELCRRIKEDPAHESLPVVLLTSLGDPVDIVRGLECGADNYVTKPYEADYLCARIRHVLDRRRLRRSSKTSVGINVSFLGTTFSISSDKEQILDLFITSVEEVVRTNAALQDSQRALAEAQERLAAHANVLAREAKVSSEKYAALMEEASDAIVLLDAGGRIVEANLRFCDMLGRSAAEVQGRALAAFARHEGGAALWNSLSRLADRIHMEVSEVEFTALDGRLVTCTFSASRTSHGPENFVMAIMHDISEQKAINERLRRSEALLAESQRFARIGSWEHDLRDGQFQWTREMYQILGFTPREVAPSFEELLFHVDATERENLRAAYDLLMRRGHPLDIELHLSRADGSPRIVQAHAEVVPNDRDMPSRIRGALQDVTERRALEEQLRQSQKMEAVGQLAGGVAHDFNNLLTVIMSYAHTLLEDLEESKDARDDVLEIRKAAERASILTRQLLAFSRQQVLRPRPLALNEVILDLRNMLSRLLREDIDMVMALDPALGVIRADPGQLEQVLVNLVVNARDAMPMGGRVTITTSSIAREGTQPPGSDTGELTHVLLTVSDIGSGMTPEVKERIFEPFFTTKETGKGTGLGLSTVYGIVRQSGGEIAVESEPGTGTTFRIYFPLTADEPAVPTHSGEHEAVRTAGERILVVEDDEALRAIAARTLRRRGYDVVEARNGREALELCDRMGSELDLVIADMVMPEVGGHELAKQIAIRCPRVKVLLMSGYTPDHAFQRGTRDRGVPFMQKPFTPERLAASVAAVLSEG